MFGHGDCERIRARPGPGRVMSIGEVAWVMSTTATTASGGAAPVLSLEVKRYSEAVAPGGCVMVTCQGRLVSGQTALLLSTVTPLLSENKRVILNLAELRHTDSMGLGALVKLYVSSKSAGSSLELMHLSQQVKNLLGMTNLLDVFTTVAEHNVKLM